MSLNCVQVAQANAGSCDDKWLSLLAAGQLIVSIIDDDERNCFPTRPLDWPLDGLVALAGHNAQTPPTLMMFIQRTTRHQKPEAAAWR